MECAVKIFDATPPFREFLSILTLKMKNCNVHAT